MIGEMPVPSNAQAVGDERPYIIRTYDRWIILLIVVVGGWFLFKPIFAFTVFYRGVSFERGVQLQTAVHYYKKSIGLDPYLDESWIALGEIYYMRARTDPEEFRKTLDTLTEGTRYNPHSGKLWFDLGRTYMLAGKDYPRALAAFTRSYSEDPKSWLAWDWAAWSSLALGDEQLAVRYWRQALKLKPENDAIRKALREHGG